MLLRNDTPLAAIGFDDLHRDGAVMAVVAVRASYALTESGALRLSERQAIALSDVYAGDPHRTPLLRANDLVGYRPYADVTVLGSAHAPGGRPAASWEVSLGLGNARTDLRVHGPRLWELDGSSWRLGPAEPAARVPLDYRLAAGGRFVGDPEGGGSPYNPIGPGLLHRDWSPAGRALRAPQIEAVDAPVTDAFAVPEPAGFGPVPPFWAWRERRCGTRDEAWARGRCPQMPADFDYRFFQVAPPRLVVRRLAAGTRVSLDGLLPTGPLGFQLPAFVPVVRHSWNDGREARAALTLDGLHLDLRAEAPPWSVDLTWRGWIARCPAYLGAGLEAVPAGQAAGLPISGEHGLRDGGEAV
ncbi:DUF2169 family type VI secretion system accessory protein [Methylobacterium sp. 22177]|uniref:DUF2169 family type VI secretion system accessory protein n=1 Tax=Methylobacterium sp. 22177 TaxID=3453885 RepID=UPI003F83F4E3